MSWPEASYPTRSDMKLSLFVVAQALLLTSVYAASKQAESSEPKVTNQVRTQSYKLLPWAVLLYMH